MIYFNEEIILIVYYFISVPSGIVEPLLQLTFAPLETKYFIIAN